MYLENKKMNRKLVVGKEIEACLNPHLLRFDDVNISENNLLFFIDAVELLTFSRIDIVIKYIYAKFRMFNLHSFWGKSIYLEYIRKSNNFLEGDGSGKVGMEAFVDSFNKLVDQMDELNSKVSVVPVDENFTIIDGSHRVGIALAKDLEVPCLYIKSHPAPKITFKTLNSDNFSNDILDNIALEYCKLKKNTYIVTVFPVAQGKNKQIEEIIACNSSIVYKKEIIFEHREDSYTQLIRELYFQEDWIGTWENYFEGARKKGEACFKKSGVTRVFLIEAKSLNHVKSIKLNIRNLFNGVQDSVHINDYHQETIHLGQIYFNDNSIHLINNIKLKEDSSFEKLLQEFKQLLKRNLIDKDLCCIDGSGIMSAYGIRMANDLDFIHHRSVEIITDNLMINSHNTESKYHSREIDDIIFNPQYHLYYCGIKFTSLEILKAMKLCRNEGKDIIDVNLINKRLQKSYDKIKVLRYFLKKKINHGGFLSSSSLRMIYLKGKGKTKNYILKLNYKLKKVLVLVQDGFKPEIRTIKYKGFKLSYSKGTSIIELNGAPPVRMGGTYEEGESKVIINWLQKTNKQKPVFLDIGANIGLITLNILAEATNTQVYAFEPGKHQQILFKETINDNNLEDRITLFECALSKESGQTNFAVHETEDCSGDGLYDTGRAGKTSRIQVAVQTLDKWWRSAGKPHVDVIKIDTEGAEYWILQGGEEMIEQCKPNIILEINSLNLQAFPHSEFTILDWFETKNYILKDCNNTPINKDNMSKALTYCENFRATPQI